MLPRFLSEIPRLLICAAVMRALGAFKQPLDSPITKVFKSWHSFERVFTDMYLDGIQTVSWGTFTFTLRVSIHVFFLQCSFNSGASFMNPETAGLAKY